MSYNFILYVLILFFVFNNFDFDEINIGIEKQPKNNVTIPFEAKSGTEKVMSFFAILSPSYPLFSYAVFIYLGFYLWDRNKKKKIIEKIENSRYRRRRYY